jgi:hypothetical protein
MKKKPGRVFGILAMAAGILLIMLEVSSYRRGGEVSWFWIVIAAFAIVLGLFDITARRK